MVEKQEFYLYKFDLEKSVCSHNAVKVFICKLHQPS